jgi:predicted CopG family antitoxin
MATSSRDGKSGGEIVELDREAIRRLEEARIEGESYSQVIKRYVRPRRTAKEIVRVMRRAAVSSAALQRIDESASRRRRSAYQSKG